MTDRKTSQPSKSTVVGLRTKVMGALLTVGLGLVCSQMTCAEVTGAWNNEDDPPNRPDGGVGDGGDTMWRCFMGTPIKEDDLLNRCTEAERVERPSAIPADKWDGKTLPFM